MEVCATFLTQKQLLCIIIGFNETIYLGDIMLNRLAYIRQEYDVTQVQIAKKLGINKSNISKWENGKGAIPLERLNYLCNYYNVTMDYALGLSDKNNNKNIQKVNKLNKQKVGERLRKIRKNNHLPLRAIAEDLNTIPSTLAYYERGRTLIQTSFAYQICQQYHISLDWLCGRL